MRILNKVSILLSTGAILTTPVLFTTSCACVRELKLTEQEAYIYERTFSLLGRNSGQCVFGTGWIISDATKTNPDDYCYYLATNWHVTHAMDRYSCNKFYYADNSLTNLTDYIDYSRYKEFKSFSVEDRNQFIYDNVVTTNLTWYPSIDLNVVKVDFGKPSGAIKTKLDNLNAFQKQNGYINKFAKDSSSIRGKKKSIGGYPKKGNSYSFGGQWESHSFPANSFNYWAKGYKKDGTNQGHAIGDPYYDQEGKIRGGSENYNYWDVSPQYELASHTDVEFMTGGASGSMMITEDYEVCGIYWGGWEDDTGTKYWPSFSIIWDDSDKDFLAPYK